MTTTSTTYPQRRLLAVVHALGPPSLPAQQPTGAMRGLVSERQLGSYADLDMARRGLTNALAVYLEQSPP